MNNHELDPLAAAVLNALDDGFEDEPTTVIDRGHLDGLRLLSQYVEEYTIEEPGDEP